MDEVTAVPFDDPIVTDEMENVAVEALQEELHVRGDSIERFEKSFAEYVGVEHAIAVDSGTRALDAFGIGPGDTVLTTPATVISTVNAIDDGNGPEVRRHRLRKLHARLR